MQLEGRMVHEPVAVRADGETQRLEGYAAVFNRETVIRDFFREVIKPGAFRSVLKAADVRALFNHDASAVLGRTGNDTLALEEDSKGLRYTVTPPETTLGRDVLALVQRGDVTGSSFGFRVKTDEWTRPSQPGELPLRTISEFEFLRDVGPVTFPAYEETTVQARDAASAAAEPEAAGDLAALSRAKAAIAVAEEECA